MSKFMYDLCVLGGGSGGVRAARIAATHGARVALVEGSMQHGPPYFSAIGGTCVNVGCVPKKLMVYGSHYGHVLHESNGYGWSNNGNELKHDWATLMENKNKEINRLNEVYGRILRNSGVEILTGFGKLKDANTVSIENGGEEDKLVVTADKVLVAVGGWPFKPAIPGIEHAMTSNEIFYMKDRPKRLVVVGGGYIAVEFACIFKGYGTDVTLMYRRDLFLRGFDNSCREHLRTEMTNQGVNLRFNTNPSSIEKQGDGSFRVTCEDGSVVECDAVLYATGRKPRTEGIGLETVGVKLGKGGAIAVDQDSRTNIPNIYAVGDVTDRINLTPVALHEGHCFADTVFGNKPRVADHSYVPACVFSNPEIGNVGHTEEEAVEKFGDVTVFEASFRPMLHTLTGMQTKTLMKLIVQNENGKVIGAHMVGPHAGETIQGIAVAIKAGATKENFDQTIGIHPSSAEEFVTMRTPTRVYLGGELQQKL